MTRAGLRLVALASALGVVLALTGCGVSTSDRPEVIGDGLVDGLGPGSGGVIPPQPDRATTPETLVDDFLKAAAGGGVAARDLMRNFLVDPLQSSWRPDEKNLDDITVIRIGGIAQTTETPEGIPVEVKYQLVGKLDEKGRVASLLDPPAKNLSMTFMVGSAEEDPTKLRIKNVDRAPSSGLYLSDTALTEFYQPQPIYFWDGDVLVPDLRYVLMTVSTTPEARANKIIDWLAAGPSPMLGDVDALPPGTGRLNGVGVVTNGSTLVVKLTPQAAKEPEARQRLVYQLRWSLRVEVRPPDIELWVGNEKVTGGTGPDFGHANLAFELDQRAHKYQIVDGKVVTIPQQDAQIVPVLAAKENQNVVSAGIARDGRRAAFVQRRPTNGQLSLVIATEGAAAKVIAMPNATQAGRPVWIPGSDRLLIVWDGQLYWVNAAGTRRSILALPGVGAVSHVSVSPDGRRVALIADGTVAVGELSTDESGVRIGATLQRLVIEAQLQPNAVAWENDRFLYVTGASAGKPTVWRVTADGVVAVPRQNVLKDMVPTDVVALPVDVYSSGGQVILYGFTANVPLGPYIVGEGLASRDKDVTLPFFTA